MLSLLAKSIFYSYENIIFTKNLRKNRPKFLVKITTLEVILCTSENNPRVVIFTSAELGSCIVHFMGRGRISNIH